MTPYDFARLVYEQEGKQGKRSLPASFDLGAYHARIYTMGSGLIYEINDGDITYQSTFSRRDHPDGEWVWVSKPISKIDAMKLRLVA